MEFHKKCDAEKEQQQREQKKPTESSMELIQVVKTHWYIQIDTHCG